MKILARYLAVSITILATLGPLFVHAYAVAIVPVDSFGTEETDDVPGWVDSVDSGGDSDTRVVSSTPLDSSATAQHARLRRGGSITLTVNREGFEDLVLKYFWNGDKQAETGDKLEVYWKKTSDSNFLPINSHEIASEDETWSGEVSVPLPAEANNTSIDIKFVGNSDHAAEEARVDDVSIEGIDVMSPVITLLGSDIEGMWDRNPYIELGVSVIDNFDGDISNQVVIDASALDKKEIGPHTVTYNAVDTSGNNAVQVIRTINIRAASSGARKSSNVPVGQVLGAFTTSETERQAQIASVKSEVASLINQLINLLQEQLTAAIQAQGN